MDFVMTYKALPGVSPEQTELVHTITSGSTYAMSGVEYEVLVNKTVSGPITITLPDDLSDGLTVVVTDGKGDLDVGTNNITVVGASGEYINDDLSYIMQGAFQSVRFRYSESSGKWNSIA